METRIKGESILLKIRLITDNDVVIDLSTLTTISVKVYHGTLETVLKEGTYADGSVTYDTVASTGIIKFHIEDGLTETALPGVYKYLVTVTETESGFSDNTDTGKYIGNAFTLK